MASPRRRRTSPSPDPAPAPSPPPPPAAATLSTAEAADALGVSARRVREMIAEGVIPAARGGSRDAWAIDRDAMLAALGKNRLAGGHGGRRPGAGRPRRSSSAPAHERRSSGRPASAPEPAPAAPAVPGMPTRVEADTRLRVITANLRQLDLLQRRGVLVPIDEVRDAWLLRIAQVRRAFDDAAETLAGDVAAEFAVPPDRLPDLETLVRDRLDRLADHLAALRFEARAPAAGRAS